MNLNPYSLLSPLPGGSCKKLVSNWCSHVWKWCGLSDRRTEEHVETDGRQRSRRFQSVLRTRVRRADPSSGSHRRIEEHRRRRCPRCHGRDLAALGRAARSRTVPEPLYPQRLQARRPANTNRRASLQRLAPLSEQIDQVDTMWDAVSRLPFDQRAPLVLRYYGQLTNKEIAHALDWPEGSVGPRITKGLRQLRKAMQ